MARDTRDILHAISYRRPQFKIIMIILIRFLVLKSTHSTCITLLIDNPITKFDTRWLRKVINPFMRLKFATLGRNEINK